VPTDPVIVGVTLGRWQTNCFIVGDRATGTCAIIDPGEHGATQVPPLLERLDLRCDGILLTHGHLDHFWAVPELARSLDVPVHLHPGDRYLWDSPVAGFGVPPEQAAAVLESQFGLVWDPPTDRLQDLDDHDRVRVGGIDFTARHTPGHTPGHVTFLGHGLDGAPIEFADGTGDPAADDVLFSGDLIFAGSVGRTDFPRGSTELLFDSIVRTVLPLEDDVLILSGHGPRTTVGRERATNPFVHMALR
jgi:hydroxyacylglutathione hydrolase